MRPDHDGIVNLRIRAMHPATHASSLWLYFVLVAGIIVLPGMDMA